MPVGATSMEEPPGPEPDSPDLTPGRLGGFGKRRGLRRCRPAPGARCQRQWPASWHLRSAASGSCLGGSQDLVETSELRWRRSFDEDASVTMRRKLPSHAGHLEASVRLCHSLTTAHCPAVGTVITTGGTFHGTFRMETSANSTTVPVRRRPAIRSTACRDEKATAAANRKRRCRGGAVTRETAGRPVAG